MKEQNRIIMKKSADICIWVTLLMLAAAALVIFGKSVLSLGMGAALKFKYINALLPAKGKSSFNQETVLWVRVLFCTGILAALLIWVRKTWSTVLTMLLCLSSVIIRMYGNARHGYGLFTFNETTGTLMMVLPFLAAGLCLFLLRELPGSAKPASAPFDGRIDLRKTLSGEEIRLLAADMRAQGLQKRRSDLTDLARSIEREGRIPSKALPLCHASTELAMMDGMVSGKMELKQLSLEKKLFGLLKQAGENPDHPLTIQQDIKPEEAAAKPEPPSAVAEPVSRPEPEKVRTDDGKQDQPPAAEPVSRPEPEKVRADDGIQDQPPAAEPVSQPEPEKVPPAVIRQEPPARPEPKKETPGLIYLHQVLTEEEIRLLTTDLGVTQNKLTSQQQILVVSIVKSMIESTGTIAEQMLDLCIASVEDTVDSMASTFGLSMSGHNSLLAKLKSLKNT